MPDKPAAQEPSPGEVAYRMAVLKRFRELLVEQRNRFRAYLDALEKQKAVIESGTTDELVAHVDLEERIIADIFSIQKVIDPLERLYMAGRPHDEGEVPRLQAVLGELQTEAIKRSKQNKALLSRRMAQVRSEIGSLRSNPYTSVKRSHFLNQGGLVDING